MGKHKHPDSPSWTEAAFAAFERWSDPDPTRNGVGRRVVAAAGGDENGAESLAPHVIPTPRDDAEDSADASLPKVPA